MKPSGDLNLPTVRRRKALYESPAFAFGRPSQHSLAQLSTLTGRQPIVMHHAPKQLARYAVERLDQVD